MLSFESLSALLLSWSPWVHLYLFVVASALLVWRIDRLAVAGAEGTLLGTLVMPYCSGLGNLLFVAVVVQSGTAMGEVVVNALVNNATNLTLLLGLPALLWGLWVLPGAGGGKKAKGSAKKARQILTERRLSRLSLLATLGAAAFFAGVLLALGHDGELSRGDGAVLVGLFVGWQALHLVDALKQNLRGSKGPGVGTWLLEGAMIVVSGFGIYVGLDGLVAWVEAGGGGWLCPEWLGWASGWLMVLPNAFLALYYGYRQRADIVFSSQAGDGHICIPLCVGLGALLAPGAVPALLVPGCLIIGGAALGHLLILAVAGGLPRWLGGLSIAAYGVFLWLGLGG